MSKSGLRLCRASFACYRQCRSCFDAAARLGFVRLHAGLAILAELATALAVEVAVWRCVQQTNPGRTPLDAFRVVLSGLAALV
jgi:hypothetical protein